MTPEEELGVEYVADFNALNRKGDAIIKDDKFVSFMQRYFGPITQEQIKARNKGLEYLVANGNLGSSINFSIKK